jgi:hypothetical protein
MWWDTDVSEVHAASNLRMRNTTYDVSDNDYGDKVDWKRLFPSNLVFPCSPMLYILPLRPAIAVIMIHEGVTKSFLTGRLEREL